MYDEETLKGIRYLPIIEVKNNILYKTNSMEGICRIYMREDLFDDYPQFKWIDDQTGNVFERKES